MIKNSEKITKQNIDMLFQNPPGEYRVFPIMHELCDPSKADNIEDEVQNARTSGAGGLVTNTTWNDKDWVNKESNLALLKKAVQTARSKGMNVWMYDDYWYPSGWANGYAMKDHPEYSVQNITYHLLEGEGIQSIQLSRKIDNWGFIYAAFYPVGGQGQADYAAPLPVDITKDSIRCSSPAGKWVFLSFYIKHHFATEQEKQEAAKSPGGYRESLNFLDKRAVDQFISAALQPVADYFDTDFGKSFDAIFTDEPTLAGHYLTFVRGKVDFKAIPAPYGPTLFEEFSQKWGYDLHEKLVYLFVGESEEAQRVRLHYYRTISDIGRRDFTGNVADWCARHDTCASGHFLLEEGLTYHVGYYGDYMKVMGGQDYPGCDVLDADAQRFWERGSGFDTSWLFAGKYPSSASRIKGHNVTMMEICPVNYSEKFAINPFKEFMGVTTSAIFTGITHYNSYGYRSIKDNDLLEQWNAYTGRLLMVLRNSISDCRLGVYYPIAVAQSRFAGQSLKIDKAVDLLPQTRILENRMEELCNRLYEGKLDFNILTEEAVMQAPLHHNSMQIGQMTVNALVVPFNDYLPLAVAEKLLAFAQKGGKVYFIDQLPLRGLDAQEDDALVRLRPLLAQQCPIIPLEEVPALTAQLRQDVAEEMQFEGEGIFTSRYRFMEQTVYYVINIKEEDTTLKINSALHKKITLRDPTDGTVRQLALPCEMTLKGERGILLFID